MKSHDLINGVQAQVLSNGYHIFCLEWVLEWVNAELYDSFDQDVHLIALLSELEQRLSAVSESVAEELAQLLEVLPFDLLLLEELHVLDEGSYLLQVLGISLMWWLLRDFDQVLYRCQKCRMVDLRSRMDP